MTINERFAEILKTKNISVKEASVLIRKSEVYVRKLMRAGESFGIEPVLLILNSIEDINPDWLLREKGSMFRSQYNTEEPAPSPPSVYFLSLRASRELSRTFQRNERIHTNRERYYTKVLLSWSFRKLSIMPRYYQHSCS